MLPKLNSTDKLTLEQIHELAIAPLPTFNIVMPKTYGAGKLSKRNSQDYFIQQLQISDK